MQAVVLSTRDGKAAVLDREGIVRAIEDRGYEAGMTIELEGSELEQSPVPDRSVGSRSRGKVVTLPGIFRNIGSIAAAALVAIAAGGVTAYAVPCSEISLDINPSLQYRINLFDRVLDVGAYNNDGEGLLDEISAQARGSSTGQALLSTFRILAREGYLEEEETSVLVSIDSSFDTAAGRIRRDIKETGDAYNISDGQNSGKVRVQEVSVSNEERMDARELGVSPARLTKVRSLEKMRGDEGNFDEKEWLGKPVAEIEKALQQTGDADATGSESEESVTPDREAVSTEAQEEQSEQEISDLGHERTIPGQETETPGSEPEKLPDKATEKGKQGASDQGTSDRPDGQTVPKHTGENVKEPEPGENAGQKTGTAPDQNEVQPPREQGQEPIEKGRLPEGQEGSMPGGDMGLGGQEGSMPGGDRVPKEQEDEGTGVDRTIAGQEAGDPGGDRTFGVEGGPPDGDRIPEEQKNGGQGGDMVPAEQGGRQP